MMMALSKEERIELVLLNGREGWSQTSCFLNTLYNTHGWSM